MNEHYNLNPVVFPMPEPVPEPVYEYRVVCADGRTVGEVPLDRIRAEALARSANTWHPMGRAHAHTIERRAVGPWEAT